MMIHQIDDVFPSWVVTPCVLLQRHCHLSATNKIKSRKPILAKCQDIAVVSAKPCLMILADQIVGRSYVGGTQLRIVKRILRCINFSAAAKEDAKAKKAASSVQKITKLATKLLTLNACRGLQPMSCRVLWSMGRVYRWVCILLSPFCPSSSSHSSSSTKIYNSFFSSPIVCSDVLSENSINTRSTKTVITASIQNHNKHN